MYPHKQMSAISHEYQIDKYLGNRPSKGLKMKRITTSALINIRKLKGSILHCACRAATNKVRFQSNITLRGSMAIQIECEEK